MASRWLAGTFALAKARAFANNRNTAAWFTCHLDPNRGKTLSTSWLKKVQPAAKKLLYSLSQIILVMLTSWSVIGWTWQLTTISGCCRWKFLVWTSLIGWMPRQSLSHPCCRGWSLIIAPCCHGQRTGQARTFQERNYDAAGSLPGECRPPGPWTIIYINGCHHNHYHSVVDIMSKHLDHLRLQK